jgi:hypothetical protein
MDVVDFKTRWAYMAEPRRLTSCGARDLSTPFHRKLNRFESSPSYAPSLDRPEASRSVGFALIRVRISTVYSILSPMNSNPSFPSLNS